jgi:hypothetical protein
VWQWEWMSSKKCRFFQVMVKFSPIRKFVLVGLRDMQLWEKLEVASEFTCNLASQNIQYLSHSSKVVILFLVVKITLSSCFMCAFHCHIYLWCTIIILFGVNWAIQTLLPYNSTVFYLTITALNLVLWNFNCKMTCGLS